MPLVPGFFSNPANTSEIEPLVVCNSVGTEIPYPSSYTITASGTCNTPAALMVSQKCPSDVLASPIVQKQTSFPSLVKPANAGSGFAFLKNFEPRANPSPLTICPAVGAMSADTFKRSVSGNHSPCSFTNGVLKCEFMFRPPLYGSFSTSAYNCAK